MSDVKAIRYLLSTSAALVAVVPATRIQAGDLPQGVALPAIGITHVSGIWRQEISKQSKSCLARVQVTVLAASYAQQKQIIELVRDAVPRTHGVVNGVQIDSILRQPDGPDMSDPALGLYIQTQDYMVNFHT
jgi:hypothetical protein